MRRETVLLSLAIGGLLLGLGQVVWLTQAHAAPMPTDNALAHTSLPYYTRADLLPRWDAHSAFAISTAALHDQFNAKVDDDWFAHGPTVVNFFFSGCTYACPISMDMLKILHGKLGAHAPQQLSISVAPLADNAPVLRDYAQRFGLPSGWRLGTGELATVQRTAQDDLLTDISHSAPDGGPPHTERALLVDRHRHIRGIYDVTQGSELTRLRYDYERLLASAGV